MANKTFFMIAGEASGDVLGASVLCGLKGQGVSPEHVSGVGGYLMEREGLKSLLPMDELCVMGLWEVIGQLPRLLGLINAMVEEVEKRQPDVLLTIDLPDFNFQVAKRLKKRGIFKGKIVHYVAPTVWAWRPGRAKKIAQYLDGMMCLFPFEPPYFEKHGLRTAYVGHPLIEVDKAKFDPVGFRQARSIPDDALCLGVLMGSREGELAALSQPFLQTVERLAEEYPNLHIIVPTLPDLEYQVAGILKDVSVPAHVITDTGYKWNAFSACDCAIAVSGTVGLELSYAGVAHVIGYKAHPLTALILRFVVKTQYAHLTNILLQREAVSEFLQGRCNAAELTHGVMRLLDDSSQDMKTQQDAFAELEQQLRLESKQTPSTRAAEFVLKA